MRRHLSVFLLLLPPAAAQVAADAQRGLSVFTAQGCPDCHTSGPGSAAPDLNRALPREYTPAGMTARLWNHAPAMWGKMRAAQREMPNLTPQDAADLFAYYYSTRTFERPGDAGRGKEVFIRAQCSQCHGVNGPATPAGRWRALGDPVDLVERMWNHAGPMRADIEAKVKRWPKLTGAEMGDLLVYLQNLPGTGNMTRYFALPGGERGQGLLLEKGCNECHKNKLALERRLGSRTLTDVSAAMWNHAPLMRNKTPGLSSAEIREIIGYAWGQSFFAPRGGASSGAKVFRTKCAECHKEGGLAPDPRGRVASAPAMVASLWRHGPQMLAQTEKAGRAWPTLTPVEMENLLAYLGSTNARVAAAGK